jgi:hypothetical protein
MGRTKTKPYEHYFTAGSNNYHIYRKAPISEVQDTELAICRYREHAELIVKALNQYVP